MKDYELAKKNATILVNNEKREKQKTDKNGNGLVALNDEKEKVDVFFEGKQTMELHWDPAIPRRGLGDLLTQANHIAITVSDVGRSLWFYSDILGFQQIRRPNFDRHGAWLTMGNIELHLILGKPVVHSGDDLIVSHISVETRNIKEVLRRLKEMEIPFETNVSVPKADENEGVVTQFFLRDPDGYYIELCNCHILTEFCLGNEKVYINGYEESAKQCVDISLLSKMILKAGKAKVGTTKYNQEKELEILKTFDETDYHSVKVDEDILQNLLKRTQIYGDCVQGETEESLREILRKTKNNVPDAILYIKAKHGDKQIFQPPTIYKNNEKEYKPPCISLEK